MAYCNVNILYGNTANAKHQHRCGAAAQLRRWRNRRLAGRMERPTQGLGGGVCAGNTIRRGCDGHRLRRVRHRRRSWWHRGHVSCANSFNPDGTFSKEYINDFFRVGVVQEVLFSKAVAKSYYGMKPAYNYWNGCSTGGRQGYQVAQTIGNEIEGILANAPAINWQRFATAQMWGEIAIKDLVGAQDVLNPRSPTRSSLMRPMQQ